MPAKQPSRPKKPRKAAARATTAKKDPWRPKLITEEVKAEICAWIATGKAVAAWCRKSGIGYQTVLNALKADAAFLGNYGQAREDSADADADSTADIRERMLTGEITPEQARVAIDQLKWAAAKRQPKKYGDKLDLNHGGSVGVHLTREQWKERMADVVKQKALGTGGTPE